MALRVMIITQSLFGGGAEKSAGYLSLGLSNKYEVILVSTNKGRIDFEYGGKLVELNCQSSSSVIKKINNLYKKIKKIKALKYQFKPDIVISFLGLPNMINALTKKDEKILLSIRNVTSSKKGRRTFLYKQWMKYLENNTDRFVTLSDYVKNDLHETYGISNKKITTIYNICDFEVIEQKLNHEECNYGKYIVSVGRLSPVKGQWHLIRAFSRIHELNPEYKLVIVGDGELENLLKKLAFDYGLENSICFTGWQANPYNIVKNADVFVFTSIYEGLGNVLLEALALSKAIVASDAIGGANEIICPEIISQGTMIDKAIFAKWAVVTPRLDYGNMNSESPLTHSEIAIVDAVDELIKNKKLRSDYESKSRDRAKDFSTELIIPMWETLINKLCL